MPRSPSGASARPSPRVSIKSLELNALHTSRIPDMVHLNGNRSKDNDKHAELMKKYPDMEHDDPNAKSVDPGKTAEILWRFSKAGEFEFACLIPGHKEAGMHGFVHVK